jgi:hypothetical protein
MLPDLSIQFDHPVFTCMEFITMFIQSKFVDLAFNPPNLKDRISVFLPPQWQGGTIIPPETRSLFVTFYDSHPYGGYILTCLHVWAYVQTCCQILFFSITIGQSARQQMLRMFQANVTMKTKQNERRNRMNSLLSTCFVERRLVLFFHCSDRCPNQLVWRDVHVLSKLDL